ncbi:MAG: aminotransferase class V-fold PLP-dependent enzyme [Acidobacteria bacterium]|nr:MAG: aminotransferase class V-fold PLP-dependent enzyme [Acidobacteriota bacterium]
MKIYLDNNSSTPLAPEIVHALRHFKPEKSLVQDAQKSVAELIGARNEEEIIFTRSGSQSNLLAFLTAIKFAPQKKHIVASSIEHVSSTRILQRLSQTGYEITFIEVDKDGLPDMCKLKNSIRKDTLIVSFTAANGDLGILTPFEKICQVVKGASEAFFHVDGAMIVGKLPLNIKHTNIDFFTISGRKIHAPRGIGALYVRKQYLPFFQKSRKIPPQKIFALGYAANLSNDQDSMMKIKRLRDKLERQILTRIPSAKTLFANASNKLPNTLLISFPNMNGEVILSALADKNIIAATLSVCNSQSHKLSSQLMSMNLHYSQIMGALRFSLSRYNTEQEIDITSQWLAHFLRKFTHVCP